MLVNLLGRSTKTTPSVGRSHDPHEVGLGGADIGRCAPAQVGVLNRIVGVARGS